jgi:DNA polymerase I
MTDQLGEYREIWLCDFEFHQPAGERPEPLCLVAREYRTGRTIRLWADELPDRPPFSVGADVLFVAYYASAEFGCFKALQWPMPSRILDLFAEFRNCTNGLSTPCGNSLLGALVYFGISGIEAAEKEAMRALTIRGGPFTAAERAALLEYCESDVVALAKLLPAMLPHIDLPRALIRGRYMPAVAAMEWTGVPIDVEMLDRIKTNWQDIKCHLIQEVDHDYGVFVPTSGCQGNLSFSTARFTEWLTKNNRQWPRLPSGQLALDDDTFRDQAKVFPAVGPLRELRHALGKLGLFDLPVGSDHRNRCLLSPFSARTSRNQPSNSKFIFGPSVWIRGLIRPEPGRAIAYVDWEQQEFGIAAALSGDVAMRAAYQSGDPYLEFARQARAVPAHATKESHKADRDRFKVCALAVQYGMGCATLAESLGAPEAYARELLRLHRATYPRFWSWSESAVNHGMLHGFLWTVFGWRLQVGRQVNPRSLANFPVQANGAEMLRLACCLATERGINVCAPVHDALMVEAAIDEIDFVVAATKAAMLEASEVVLSGFGIRTDTNIVQYPERYCDPRGTKMWGTVTRLLHELQSAPIRHTRPIVPPAPD